MKLGLKHFAAYLPYGLICEVINWDAKISRYMTTISELHAVYSDGSCVFHDLVESEQGFESVRPILYHKTHLHNLQNEILIRWGGGLSDKGKAKWLKEVTDDMLYSAVNSLRYDFVKFMLENHIDIFGLIEEGLATDANKLK